MKKIIIFVANNYTFDSRVQRESLSLSKKYDVVVWGLTNSKKDKPVEKINSHLTIKRKYVSWPISNIFIILFGQKIFKKLVEKDKGDIYHCNDPDTMIAGVYAKKIYNSKIIYDSHELWSNISHRHSFIARIYSYVYSKMYYFLERKYVKYFDKIITVSEPIKRILEKRYHKSVKLIYNKENYIKIKNINKQDKAVYVGKIRTKVLYFSSLLADKLNFNVNIFGFKKYNYDNNINFFGKIDPKLFVKYMPYYKLGLCIYGKDSKSVYLTTPNKLFQYLQYEIPIIAPDYPGLKLIDDFKIGETFNINDDFDFIIKAQKIINNFDFYLKNIQKIKKKMSWESQEKELFKIYKFDEI